MPAGEKPKNELEIAGGAYIGRKPALVSHRDLAVNDRICSLLYIEHIRKFQQKRLILPGFDKG